VELILGSDEKKIFSNERVQKALANVFTIFIHRPSYGISSGHYDRIQTALTGRDWKSFNKVLKFRSEDEIFLNDINFEPKKTDLISALEIIHLIETKNTDLSDSEIIWLALGELIK